MLTLTIKEIENLISTLKWVQVATLSTEEDRESTQDLIEKFKVVKKLAIKERVKIVIA